MTQTETTTQIPSPERIKQLLNRGNYSMMLGLQCERTDEELANEKEEYTIIMKAISKDAETRQKQVQFVKSQIESINYGLRDHKRKRLSEIVPTHEHVKLLQHMHFEGIWFGDVVSIGVDGKRPFGNSNYRKDVARILEWELPNDDLSNEQEKHAEQLMEELPYALNILIGRFSL